MFVTTHAGVGATLGLAIARRPTPIRLLTALTVGVVSHLVLDSTPHWGMDKSAGTPEERDRTFMRVARRDGLGSLALTAALTTVVPRPARMAVLVGAAGALWPDLEYPAQRYLHRSITPAQFRRVHSRVQRGREAPSRLGQEIATIAITSVAALATAYAWTRADRS